MPPLTADWISIAALVGALQGFLLAGVLAAHRSNRTANRLLAMLVVTFTIYLISAVYNSAGYERVYPHFFGVGYPLPWAYGPLIYLYALAASDRSRRLRPRDALHFVPIAVVVIALVPIYLMTGTEKIAVFARLRLGDPPTAIRVLDPFKYVSGLSYTAATVLFLTRHRARVKDNYSSIERVNLRWLLWLACATAAIWMLAAPIGLARILHQPHPQHRDDLVTLAIALLVYAIGYMGLRQPEIFVYAGLDQQPGTAAPSAGAVLPSVAAPAGETAALGDAPPSAPTPPPARYERSGLTDREAAELKDALVDVMTRDRPYRDPDLTLGGLAERLGTTPHKLSEVLNGELAVTFFDFVNRYRVEEVRQQIADGKSKYRKLLALAMDAGFASKSTFNQVFKNQTGQTPSTYRKAIAG